MPQKVSRKGVVPGVRVWGFRKPLALSLKSWEGLKVALKLEAQVCKFHTHSHQDPASLPSLVDPTVHPCTIEPKLFFLLKSKHMRCEKSASEGA